MSKGCSHGYHINLREGIEQGVKQVERQGVQHEWRGRAAISQIPQHMSGARRKYLSCQDLLIEIPKSDLSLKSPLKHCLKIHTP